MVPLYKYYKNDKLEEDHMGRTFSMQEMINTKRWGTDFERQHFVWWRVIFMDLQFVAGCVIPF